MNDHRRFLAGGSTLLLLLTCIVTIPLEAQNGFTVTIPGIESAPRQSTLQTPDGGFVVLFRSFYGKEGTSQDELDSSFFGLMKLSADGILEWSRQFRIGIRNAEPITLLQTAEGGFIALGNITDSEDGLEENRRIAALRVSAHGYLLWAKQYDINGDVIMADGIMLDDENLLVCGLTAPMEAMYSHIVTMRISLDGEVVNAQEYPELRSYMHHSAFSLRTNESGFINIFGTTIQFKDNETEYDEEYQVEMVGVCDENGTMESITVLDFEAGDIEPYIYGPIITDLHRLSDGSLMLLGVESFYGCSSSHHYSFLAYTDPNNNLLDIQWLSSDFSLASYHILPSGSDNTRIVGIREDRAAFNYIVTELDKHSAMTGATLLAPLGERNSTEHGTYWMSEQSTSVVNTENNDLVFTESHFNTVLEDAHSYRSERLLMLTRISPDLYTCSGIQQSLRTEDGQIFMFEREQTDPYSTDVEDETLDQTAQEDFSKVSQHYAVKASTTETQVKTLTHKTLDHPLQQQVICQENPLVHTASLDNSEMHEKSESLLKISPNIIVGEDELTVDFTIAGNHIPHISLINIATGETVRQVEHDAVQWNRNTGHGTAAMDTYGLTSGTYLVRVRTGEKQMTGRIEVQ